MNSIFKILSKYIILLHKVMFKTLKSNISHVSASWDNTNSTSFHTISDLHCNAGKCSHISQ